MKILTVVGARPQFIKAAPVSKAISKGSNIDEIIIHTGQHFDTNMSAIFFDQLDIPQPKYNLGVSSLSHGAMTGRMLESIEKIILDEKPSAILVYGDTNSTLAGALAAKKLGVKVAHVEAGLRSFNIAMPEEQNRILVDNISDLLLCPTDVALANLYKEGFDSRNCIFTNVGDVMYDSLLLFSDHAQKPEWFTADIADEKQFLFVTLHRAENTNNKQKLESIVRSLNMLGKEYKIIFPVHPRTKNILESYGLHLEFETYSPVGYLETLFLLSRCALVLTDSGGLQKEAYFSGKRCVTLRDETEWVELVNRGVNVVVGSDLDQIVSTAQSFLVDHSTIDNKGEYGDGHASEKISLLLERCLSNEV